MASGSNYTGIMPVEHNFDYVKTKAAFNQEVGYVLVEKKLQTRVILRQDDVEKIISDIKRGTQHYKKYYTEKCQVVNENGKDILCHVTTRYFNNTFNVLKIKQIMCVDETFDVLFELHMQKPYLEESEIVEHFYNSILFRSLITLFWKSCETCNTTFKNIDIHFRLIGEITILKMASKDGKFTHILLYIERNTNFVCIRPIKSLTNGEIAYELLTIFADFGPPSYMDSDQFKDIYQYNDALKILMSLNPPFRVPTMYASSRNHKIQVISQKVIKMLKEWKKNTESSNWAIGAHVVQWRMNIEKVDNTYIRSRVISGPLESPYHAMFGILPRTDLVKIKNNRQSGSKMSKEKVLVDCSQCSLPMYKAFKCHFCKALCHFSCCVRYVEHAPYQAVIINKCLSCVNGGMSMDEEVILGT